MKITSVVIFVICTIFFLAKKTEIKEAILYSSFVDIYLEHFRDGKCVDKDHLLTTIDNGMPIVVNRYDRCVCRFIRLFGCWDSKETAVVKMLVKPGMQVVEVGANFGVHTLRMASIIGKNGHIDAFEANPCVSKYLRMSIDLNHLESVVTLHEEAAGDLNCETHLTFGLSNIGGGYITNASCDNAVPTKMVRLDDVLRNKKVDLLKIDAEGSEGKIIDGAKNIIKNNPDIIFMMEWVQSHLLRQGTSPSNLVNFFKSLGFRVWKISKRSEDKKILVPLSYEELTALTVGDIIVSRKNILL